LVVAALGRASPAPRPRLARANKKVRAQHSSLSIQLSVDSDIIRHREG
jgi:hypothetical protein